MNGRFAVLLAAEMQGRTTTPFHLRPLQVGDLDGAQSMPKPTRMSVASRWP
jgi:hypothetical protein